VKEFTFIRSNIDKWQKAEIVVDNADNVTPDRLAEVYVDLTSDLAFAQTHYPNSEITVYLNNICSDLHYKIYRTKREKWSRLITFWTHEVPLVMYENRRLLLLSFVVFLFSIFVGALSQYLDPEFSRTVLGDGYVDMTIYNIEKGRPVDVYNMDDETPMFLSITLNNIYVSFLMFVSGIFTSVMSAVYLFMNCVSLGSLEVLFYQHGCLGKSLLAVMLHGTLELSAIIIAAAASMAMGNGWLFPGTYSRTTSFVMGAKRGLKIVVGTIPVFIVAGFIEGFLTRHTEAPDALRLAFIMLSLVFVLSYFVWLPYRRHREELKKTETKKNFRF